MPEPRTFAAYLDRTERDQLDARAAAAEQERDEALDARDVLRTRLNDVLTLASFRKGVIERYRQEVGAAGDVLAVVRDAAERIDRALATYDTTPGSADLGSPAPRAQEVPVAVNLGERIRVLHPSPGGCDRCSVEPGERHRYPECPGNRRDAEARP